MNEFWQLVLYRHTEEEALLILNMECYLLEIFDDSELRTSICQRLRESLFLFENCTHMPVVYRIGEIISTFAEGTSHNAHY